MTSRRRVSSPARTNNTSIVSLTTARCTAVHPRSPFPGLTAVIGVRGEGGKRAGIEAFDEALAERPCGGEQGVADPDLLPDDDAGYGGIGAGGVDCGFVGEVVED